MKKSAISILTTIVILLSLLGPMLYNPIVQAADPEDWYITENGVLTSDYYTLYPYEEQSIDIGLSKYGEMINGHAGYPDVGLQYPGYDAVGTYDQGLGTSRDPFANEGIPRNLWLNGWLLEVRYTHRTRRDRRILAMAMYADMSSYGGDWSNGHSLTLEASPFGGRKTTGYAETEPLQVLYDGPRRFVALSTTHIYDWEDGNENGVVDHPDETWAILDLKLTFIFNKVKKEVIILKDVKKVITGKELDSPLDVQLSNREEWDLGPSPDWGSYAHFYHQELETCFGPEWHLAPGIMREYIYKDLGPIAGVPVWSEPYGPPIATGSVRIYVNGEFKEEGEDYDINYDTGEITWYISVAYTDEVEVVYKLWKYSVDTDMVEASAAATLNGFIGTPYDGVPHLYDVAQIISSDFEYVGWKAFWPTLSDYTVDGWSQSFIPLINVSHPDIVPIEPEIPFVIGEWDFMLGKGYPMQFRGVEVVGLTDYDDAWDMDAGMGPNVIEREAMYQLNEVFNPMDLLSAVHKSSARWVEFETITLVGETFTTDIENVAVIVRPDPYSDYVEIGLSGNDYIPGPTEWDQYCVDSESILNLDTGILLIRGVHYDIVQNADGTATITFYVTGHMKILYSTMGMYVTTEDNADNFCLFDVPDYDMDYYMWGDDAEVPIEFYICTPAPTQSYKTATLKIRAYDVDVELDEIDAVYLNGRLVGILGGDTAEWAISEFECPGGILDITGLQLVQIFVSVDYTEPLPETIDPYDDTTWPNMTTLWAVTVDWGSIVFNYGEYVPMPRYEWITVGRDAHTADSLGSALVAAAFKDKQVEIGYAGMDMMFQEWSVSSIPYLLNCFGTAPGWPPDYKDSLYRIALKDDWCHTWPVASSNIIAEGGPLANHVTEYFNDFTDAFYGLNTVEAPFTPYAPWADKVVPLTCWNRAWNGTWNTYTSDSSTGYAVIATYKDINGTVGLVVWGINARDTFYASKFFKEEIIFELQEFPRCATSIIIEICYGDPMHPTFTIPEVLGTISETTVEYIKGGIHDP